MRNKRKTSNHEQLDLFGATDKAKREFGAKAGVEELASNSISAAPKPTQ
jgi:hypothetical protein